MERALRLSDTGKPLGHVHGALRSLRQRLVVLRRRPDRVGIPGERGATELHRPRIGVGGVRHGGQVSPVVVLRTEPETPAFDPVGDPPQEVGVDGGRANRGAGIRGTQGFHVQPVLPERLCELPVLARAECVGGLAVLGLCLDLLQAMHHRLVLLALGSVRVRLCALPLERGKEVRRTSAEGLRDVPFLAQQGRALGRGFRLRQAGLAPELLRVLQRGDDGIRSACRLGACVRPHGPRAADGRDEQGQQRSADHETLASGTSLAIRLGLRLLGGGPRLGGREASLPGALLHRREVVVHSLGHYARVTRSIRTQGFEASAAERDECRIRATRIEACVGVVESGLRGERQDLLPLADVGGAPVRISQRIAPRAKTSVRSSRSSTSPSACSGGM